jgi:SNF2 family DNA or RNA helicase
MIESTIRLPGFCKKKRKQDIYAYPETPCSIYRLAKAGDDQWVDYPELKKQWDDHMRGVAVTRTTDLKHSDPTIWKHQILAWNWIKTIPAGLLWAHMGTGKTRIIAEILKSNHYKKVLIVSPLHVIETWIQQLKLWYDIECKVNVKTKGENIVIQNYESLWRGAFGKWTLKQDWDLVVLDECQCIKNPGSKQSKFCFKLGQIAHKKIAMSGTPITSGPLDAFGIYRFLDPGMFGQSYKRFEHKYAYTIDCKNYSKIEGYRNQQDFQNCFNFLCLRIESDVLDLPPISYSTVLVDMPTKARTFYDDLEKKFIAYLDDEAMSVPNVLTKLLRLQGLTSGVARLDNGEVVTIHKAKQNALESILSGIDEPVVVFGRFRHDLKICYEVCKKLDRQYSELSGTRKELSQWGDVLGVQIQTGRTGIDLTKASIAIFLSTGYDWGNLEQAICRVYRPPQDKPVRIIHIHCKDSLDEKIAKILKSKQEIIKCLKKSQK